MKKKRRNVESFTFSVRQFEHRFRSHDYYMRRETVFPHFECVCALTGTRSKFDRLTTFHCFVDAIVFSFFFVFIRAVDVIAALLKHFIRWKMLSVCVSLKYKIQLLHFNHFFAIFISFVRSFVGQQLNSAHFTIYWHNRVSGHEHSCEENTKDCNKYNLITINTFQWVFLTRKYTSK